MNKTELVAYIAENADLSKAKAAEVVEVFQNGIIEGVKSGKVVITGFCTLERKDKPARTGRNPRTGEAVAIPAQTTVGFKLGSKFKEELNK